MALTTAVGYDGAFTTVSGYNGTYFAWTGELSMAVTETTGYGDYGRTYRGGIYGMTFTAQGQPKFDVSTSEPIPTSATPSADAITPTRAGASVTLQVAATCTFAGTALIETTSFATDLRTNEASLTQAGRFSGTITQAWDES
jgi:hypothetical protein